MKQLFHCAVKIRTLGVAQGKLLRQLINRIGAAEECESSTGRFEGKKS